MGWESKKRACNGNSLFLSNSHGHTLRLVRTAGSVGRVDRTLPPPAGGARATGPRLEDRRPAVRGRGRRPSSAGAWLEAEAHDRSLAAQGARGRGSRLGPSRALAGRGVGGVGGSRAANGRAPLEQLQRAGARPRRRRGGGARRGEAGGGEAAAGAGPGHKQWRRDHGGRGRCSTSPAAPLRVGGGGGGGGDAAPGGEG